MGRGNEREEVSGKKKKGEGWEKSEKQRETKRPKSGIDSLRVSEVNVLFHYTLTFLSMFRPFIAFVLECKVGKIKKILATSICDKNE